MDYDTVARKRDWAARKIQATWRARKQRKAFNRLKDAVQTIQAMAKGWYVRKKIREMRNREDLDKRFQQIMDRHREKIQVLEMEKRAVQALPGSELEEWEARRMLAAVKVQAHWRGLVQRRKFAKSPERVKREQAAVRIQGAFKKLLKQRRSVQSLIGASVATDASSRQGSPQMLRQSGASVLLGSPQLRQSPTGASTGGSPFKQAVGAAPGAPGSYMSAKRYKELDNQVSGRINAYVALAKHRSQAKRADPRQTDARLQQLLRNYHETAPMRISAAHTRQRNLVVMDSLCAQLEQMKPLKDLPEDARPQDFPRPARGSERMERASQAHALMLAEARVGSRWWKHLKGLNTKAVQDSLLAEDAERWQELDARWRRMWAQIEEQENRRPDVLEELAPPVGVGKATLEAAKEAAVLAARQAEYSALAEALKQMPSTPVIKTRASYM